MFRINSESIRSNYVHCEWKITSATIFPRLPSSLSRLYWTRHILHSSIVEHHWIQLHQLQWWRQFAWYCSVFIPQRDITEVCGESYRFTIKRTFSAFQNHHYIEVKLLKICVSIMTSEYSTDDASKDTLYHRKLWCAWSTLVLKACFWPKSFSAPYDWTRQDDSSTQVLLQGFGLTQL